MVVLRCSLARDCVMQGKCFTVLITPTLLTCSAGMLIAPRLFYPIQSSPIQSNLIQSSPVLSYPICCLRVVYLSCEDTIEGDAH